MSVSLKDLQTQDVNIRKDVKHSEGRSHHAWILSELNPLGFIYDPWHLEGYSSPWTKTASVFSEMDAEHAVALYPSRNFWTSYTKLIGI